MLCDKCQQREAKILYTEIIDGIKKEQHLCEECAAKYTSFKLSKPIEGAELTLGDLLSSIFDSYYSNSVNESQQEQELYCSKCHTTYSDFLKNGRIGCMECYHSFASVFDKTLKSIQGTDTHRGKRPTEFMKKTAPLMELEPIERLTLELHTAIENEEYEEAARIRDEIRAIKGDIKNVEGI